MSAFFFLRVQKELTSIDEAAGDRSHIPEASKPIYEILSGELTKVKQSNIPVCAVAVMYIVKYLLSTV